MDSLLERKSRNLKYNQFQGMKALKNHLFVSFFLMLFISSCSRMDANYRFPTGKQQRVLELCALVFTEPHYQHISPSRKVKLNKLRTTSWGFWATFADGRTYKVPIASGLPEGENYYCNYQPLPTPCASRNDWDERCNWDNTYHPNRFQ